MCAAVTPGIKTQYRFNKLYVFKTFTKRKYTKRYSGANDFNIIRQNKPFGEKRPLEWTDVFSATEQNVQETFKIKSGSVFLTSYLVER